VAHRLTLDEVVRLWLHRQGLLRPRGRRLTKRAFTDHLERTGGLQLDSVNVLDRAHYLTLWSRFGSYDRRTADRFSYDEGLAYEHIGHAACLLPVSRMPLSRRAMREFVPRGGYWPVGIEKPAAWRGVLRLLRDEGPQESAPLKAAIVPQSEGWHPSARNLVLAYLWYRGDLAVATRRRFRRVFDLPENVYPPGPVASRREHEDDRLLAGLSGNGAAPPSHLGDYLTGPRPRREVLRRNLATGRVVEVEVEGRSEAWYMLAEHLDEVSRLPPPHGTNLICPFDSLLWQRRRAEDLLGFRYRIEIYVPPAKRRYGYYVLPVLHEGRLVARLDPKLDRRSGRLLIHAIHVEPGFAPDEEFRAGLGEALRELAEWLGADAVSLPKEWRDLAP
jgi:uncharacterized protein YcaQ